MDNLTPMDIQIQIEAAKAARDVLAAGWRRHRSPGVLNYLRKQDVEVRRLKVVLERMMRCDDR